MYVIAHTLTRTQVAVQGTKNIVVKDIINIDGTMPKGSFLTFFAFALQPTRKEKKKYNQPSPSLPLVPLFPLFLHQIDSLLIYTIHRIFIRQHSYGCRVHSFFIVFFLFLLSQFIVFALYLFHYIFMHIYILEISLFPSQ